MGQTCCREAGLFPEGDPFLEKLMAQEGLHPFEKHLAGADSPYQSLPKGGWVTGNAAAENGIDLRLFYEVVSSNVTLIFLQPAA